MSERTLGLFIKYKRGPAERVLMNDDNKPVKDIKGEELMCQGDWKDPGNAEQFIAAIRALHESRGQRGPFQEKCNDCIQLDGDKIYTGCRYHRGQPQLWRKGFPRDSNYMDNVMAQSSRDGASYVVEGDTPLTPMELISMHTRLTASNRLADYQHWVMTLVACKLFLREEELADLKFEDPESKNCINWDVTLGKCHQTTGLDGIAFNIQGKSDENPVTLMLWADDSLPLLCPIRHLMIYLHLTGIRCGYIFPHPKEFDEIAENDGVAETKIPYGLYQTNHVRHCKAVCPRDGKFGSHCNRKTAYLLALWGGGSDSEVKDGARHKTEVNAAKYKQDARFLLELANANELDVMISPWRPIYCANVQMGRSLNAQSLRTPRNLKLIADNYVVNLLQIPEDHPNRTIPFLVEKALAYRRPSSDEERLDTILQELPQDKADAIKQVMASMVVQARTDAFAQAPRVVIPAQAAAVGPAAEDDGEGNNDENVRPAKKARGGDNDLELRHEVKKCKNVAEKLDLLIRIKSMVPNDRITLTEGARAFVNGSVVPVMTCFEKHFNCNKDEFMAKHGQQFSPSTFKKMSDELSCQWHVRSRRVVVELNN